MNQTEQTVYTKRSLFDAIEGDRLKTEGMAMAADKPGRILMMYFAKGIAQDMARKHGEVTIDDVYRLLPYTSWQKDLGNAAGSVFKGSEWEFTGRWQKSTRTSNHGRWIRVWRLK